VCSKHPVNVCLYVVGYWSPRYGDRQPYLQVDLRSLYRVTGLRVKGSGSRWSYVTSIIVFYSENGWTWSAYSDDQSDSPRQFDANHGDDTNHINFAKPFTVELLCLFSRPFLRAKACCFQRVLAIAILSVCPSIRLSHGWITQKRCKLGSSSLHRRLPGRL